MIYRHAIGRDQVDVNPAHGLQLPAVRSKRRAVASPEQAERLLAVLDPAPRALWATAIYAGLRRGELTGLR